MMSARKFAFIIFIVLFLAVKLISLSHPVGWDEAVYLGMGKYIYSGGESGLWEDIRPSGLPLVLGLVLVAPSHFIAISAVIVLFFSVGVVILTFQLGKLYDRNTGMTAAGLLALTPVFFSSSSEIMSSIPATFFSLLALYLYLTNRHLVLVGLSAGGAFLFRFPQGLTFAALFLVILIVHRSVRKLGYLALGFGAVVTAFLAFNFWMYQDITGSAVDAVFRPFLFAVKHQANPFHQESVFFYGKMLLLESALFAFALLGMFSRRMRIFVVVSGLYIAYYTLIPNKQERFLLDFLPYLSILAGAGIVRAYHLLKFSTALRIALAVLCFIPVGQMIFIDYSIYSEGDAEPLEHFFSSIPRGVVLTMTPLPVAYSDTLFIPMYDNPKVALDIYAEWEERADYVLYFSDYYPCLPEDIDCVGKKRELEELLRQHPVVSQTHINGQGYILYNLS
jgi:4-amino-4-deoxy-L-arabinose transferase-like glycosyltransferase